MADIIIAPMTSGQVEAVAAIEKECFSTPWSCKAFSDAVESELYDYITAVAGEDGAVVGYAGMQVVLDEAEITNIAVDAPYRKIFFIAYLVHLADVPDTVHIKMVKRHSSVMVFLHNRKCRAVNIVRHSQSAGKALCKNCLSGS
mgnify:CR=1 FL=1